RTDRAIVRSTIELARSLGLRVVAEGVENADTWHELARLGCDQAQGFFLSRPVPGSELTAWLRRRRDERAEQGVPGSGNFDRPD
ncbi:MAG: diguanylate cyclase/phosphodiesterase (GGDEF & EAL domains) with PAS/PAC sensor(s), partial [uncultured Solirubrobacterales bacterium]